MEAYLYCAMQDQMGRQGMEKVRFALSLNLGQAPEAGLKTL